MQIELRSVVFLTVVSDFKILTNPLSNRLLSRAVRVNRLLAVLLLLLCSSSLARAAGEVVTDLAALARSHNVTILGENHRRSESPDLVLALADELTGAGECLLVALEIDSSQQAAVQAVMTGRMAVFDVAIAPTIDHAAYRNMLLGLARLARTKRCLKVQAIDRASAGVVSRDQWMAWLIGSLAKKWRVLALVGNVHTMKKIRWLNGSNTRLLAGLLLQARLSVLSIMQDWEEGCGYRRGRYLDIQHPRAVEVVLGIVSMIAAEPPVRVQAVADGAVIWECIDQLDPGID